MGNFSSVGRGPEFESPIIFEHIDLFNSHLNIYDGSLGLMTRVDLAHSIKENRYIYSSTPINDTLKENRPIRVFFETANLNCVELEGSWFSLYNKENHSFTDIEFPKLDFPLPDENMNYYLFNPEICYNAALGKFAVSSYSVGYLSFFDTTGTHLNTISYDPDYMEDLESFLLHKSGTPKIYIGNMHADDKHIFALNASEVDGETMEKVELLIFDWDGVPVKKLLLDRAIGAVAFDHENKRMYGYAPYEEELVLYEYDMTTWGL
ncbi:hypothetical protein [Geofilum rubicundum]|uniref:hypothetical protein n=1 Tax=Geofilum rubicundum TaxID=472113 RepID=UPI0012F949BB|nr:hypothetical protein [Geofilum rubicundum]